MWNSVPKLAIFREVMAVSGWSDPLRNKVIDIEPACSTKTNRVVLRAVCQLQLNMDMAACTEVFSRMTLGCGAANVSISVVQ